jgi:hypothetical protein
MYVSGQGQAPAALLARNRPATTIRRLGGPQDQSERVRKFSPPPGFDPRTVKPVATWYTDRVIPAPELHVVEE